MAKIITNGSASGHIDGTDGDDTIEGRGGDDQIGGHGGKDLIDGGIGDDHLHGGGKRDTLTGGDGEDWFVFKEYGKRDGDIITDFSHADDTIYLDHHVFRALHKGQLDTSEFWDGKKAHDGDDHLIYNHKTGNLYYDDDGKGGHKQQFIAKLENHETIDASDLFVF